jgi:hypothetical protein
VIKRIIAIAVVYLIAAAGWVFLGGTIVTRTNTQDATLKREVGQLWGVPLEQRAPAASLVIERAAAESQVVNGKVEVKAASSQPAVEKLDVPIVQNDIRVGLELDQRQKGLLWYSTYRVRFSANYVFENFHDRGGELNLSFTLPATNSLYDEFKFEVDGKQIKTHPQNGGALLAKVACEPRSRHSLAVNYLSNGMDSFSYRFGDGMSEVRNFSLVATTNFDGHDHPANTVSPTTKERAGAGWQLTWSYTDLISGNGIGIEMPQRINPGPMAARISYFAPVSLGFFFFLIFIISMLRGVVIHPMNYFFIAASFFAFHLLLAYLVDHISIHSAFVLCSMVSIILVVSYMRVVVGNRFAFFETALAQVIYLIGFSYAFFFEGFTGLAVAIGAIITLFVVMQMTARINWEEKIQIGNRNPQPAQLEAE